jgi:hypothetical protein
MQSTVVFQMIGARIDKHPIFYNPVWRTIFRTQREQIFDLKSSNCADFYSLDLMINQNPICIQNRNSFFNFLLLYKQRRYPF